MKRLVKAISAWSCFAIVVLALVGCKFKNSTKASPREVPFRVGSGENVLKNGYMFNPSDTNCGGFPQLRIETMNGTCVGMIKQSDDAAFHPRVILEIPGKNNEFLITDFAGWDNTNGKIWYLKNTGSFKTVVMTPILKGLSVPHQIIAGPEALIYFAEDARIRAFPITALNGAQPIPRESIIDIITDLPPMFSSGKKNSMHPLKNFIFDSQNNIYVNIGAYTDHCSDFKGKECHEADISFGGDGSSDVRDHGAVIRKYKFNGTLSKKWDQRYSIVARGLRNSMGLFFSANGDLIQVENGRDFNESTRPFEELNVIRKAELEGQGEIPHFGWPYCYDYNSTSDEWKGAFFSCDPSRNTQYRPPYVFLPPHSSPLGIIRYSGSMFPQLKDKILVSLHGYRSTGHRIIALQADPATGLPIRTGKGSYRDDDNAGGTKAFERAYPDAPSAAPSEDVILGWYDAPGYRPRGAPVAITQASDGSIWIADDKSHAIFRLAQAPANFSALEAAPRPNFAQAYSQIIAETPEFRSASDVLVKKVITSPQCEGCHDSYTNTGDNTADGLHHLRYILGMGNWVIPGNLEESTLFTKMSPPGNSVCGTLSGETYLFAASNNPAILGGQKMLQVVLKPSSKLITEKNCSTFDTFYVAQDDLETLIN